MNRIHFNTAGAGVPEPAAVAAAERFTRLEAEIGPYEAEERYARELNRDVYQALGRLLNCPADEIALFGSATDAWRRVVSGHRPAPGSRIWTTPYEYGANLTTLAALCDQHRCELTVIPTMPDGELDLDWMRTHLDETVSLVSLVHMPSGAGTVLPIAEVGALLAGSDAIYTVDACQTVGQLPLDVQQIGCDLLTGAGRKYLCGPRGTGFARVSRRIWDLARPEFVDVHAADPLPDGSYRDLADSALRFETAERGSAAVLGLLSAVELTLERADTGGLGADDEVFALLRQTLEAVPGVRLLTAGRRQSGIVSLVHERLSAERIRAGLSAQDINVWAAYGSHTPLLFAPLGVDRFIRTSVHRYNTVAEVEKLGQALCRIVAD